MAERSRCLSSTVSSVLRPTSYLPLLDICICSPATVDRGSNSYMHDVSTVSLPICQIPRYGGLNYSLLLRWPSCFLYASFLRVSFFFLPFHYVQSVSFPVSGPHVPACPPICSREAPMTQEFRKERATRKHSLRPLANMTFCH